MRLLIALGFLVASYVFMLNYSTNVALDQMQHVQTVYEQTAAQTDAAIAGVQTK